MLGRVGASGYISPIVIPFFGVQIVKFDDNSQVCFIFVVLMF